ncbi:MAG: response regulator [Deltaproteobacteria bacterium]|nr:response regulator [Deltaproteobacteria bacterium]
MAKILVVDDDLDFREMLCFSLRKDGFEVSEASDGNKAIKLVGCEPVDLVITDLIMPNKEGIELIMELRRTMPGIKIIAMSGGGRVSPKSYLAVANALGADRTIAKPVFRDDLIKVIGELLGDK